MDRKRNYRDESEAAGEDSSVVVGRNPVLELLSSGAQIEKIYIQRGEREGSVKKIFAEAKARGIPVSEADRHRLDTLAAGNAHQGVAAIAGGKRIFEHRGYCCCRKGKGRKAAYHRLRWGGGPA